MSKEIQAISIKQDGTVTKVNPSNGDYFSLDELQAFVGGYIEVIHVVGDLLMIVNEEGKLHNQGINSVANLFYLNPYENIVGDVVLINKNQLD